MDAFKWTVVAMLAFMGLVLFLGFKGSSEYHAEVQKLQGNCKVVGDAYDDQGEQGSSMRTMYQCPDGIFHIR